MEAQLRSASEPDGVDFPFDAGFLATEKLWTLTTKHGDLDLVLAPAGLAGFEQLADPCGWRPNPISTSRWLPCQM